MGNSIILLLALLFMSGCTHSQVDPKPSESVGSIDFSSAIQLVVGNEWVYEVIETNLITGETKSLNDEIISIIDSRSFGNGSAFVMVSNEKYFFERILVDSVGDLVDIHTNEIIFSSKTGIILDDDYNLIKMELASEIITVPVGSFETIIYSWVSKLNNTTVNHFYAPDIGLVKQVYTWKERVVEYNLEKYDISK